MASSAEFLDQVAVVDGADTPLGAAVVRYLCARGARAALLGDDPARLQTISAEVGSVAEWVLADGDDLHDVVGSVAANLGAVDMAFSARGSVIRDWDVSEDAASMRDAVDRDLLRVMRWVKATAEYFSGRQEGRIVTTAVAAGWYGLEGAATFSAISGAIAGLTKSYALALREAGVAVNAIAPILNQASGGGIVDETSVLDADLYSPDAIAPVAAFLLSDQCQVTGQILSVGAGRTARTLVGTVAGRFDPEADHLAIGRNLEEILAAENPVMLDDSRDELLLIEV
jgi:NAD(P)-dependent dehydrogenase (short-subunit alcohol dehydrogenase family)